MQLTRPQVYVIARPEIDWDGLGTYLEQVGAEDWYDKHSDYDQLRPTSDGQMLIEVAGRACYRSWEPGLNPNVTKVRTDQEEYLRNILRSGHGSVLEHAYYSFAFRHISRVLTHELVRHRPGTAISQESMRYVRLTDIPFWLPDWVQDDELLKTAILQHLATQESFLLWLADYFDLDNPTIRFQDKKAKTSFMRRFAPDGVATDMIWTCNVRELRHIITMRTDPSAEEEIRLVFAQVARLMVMECPQLFGDFEERPDGSWVPVYKKV
jgi:thymidylate synthase (FAD)